MPSIFLSYRREDSVAYCDRIMDYLSTSFGRRAIFRDTQTIPAGSNYLIILKAALQDCRVQLVLIGPRWMDCRDASGQRRLEYPHDPVRFEIATALQKGKDVIPVLLGGARLPAVSDLPPELAPLAARQCVVVRDDPWFIQDVSNLQRLLTRHLRWTPSSIGLGFWGLLSFVFFFLILFDFTFPSLALLFQYSWLVPVPGLILALVRSWRTRSWMWFISLSVLSVVYAVTAVPFWFITSAFLGIFLFDLVAINLALLGFGALGPRAPIRGRRKKGFKS